MSPMRLGLRVTCLRARQRSFSSAAVRSPSARRSLIRVFLVRVEGRSRGIEGSREPTWDEVEQRRKVFAPWAEERLVLDSVFKLSRNTETALEFLRAEASAT
jgi:hypothetical protein